MADKLYQDDFVQKGKKDVMLEIDFKSPIQHCLYKNEKSFKES